MATAPKVVEEERLQTPEEIASAIVTDVNWQMDNFLPAKGELSSSCQDRRYREAITEAIKEDRQRTGIELTRLKEEMSELKSRMMREISLYGRLTENLLRPENGDNNRS